MKINNIIEYHISGGKVHTGKVVKVNNKSVIVIDDKTGERIKILKTKTGLEYE